METIVNQYDGPRRPAKRMPSGQFSLDYAYSDSAAEVDSGVRDTIKGVRLSILAMGIALARFRQREMYIDLHYHSMSEYIEKLCEDMQIDRSTPHYWLQIGEAFLKHQKDLEKIKFTDEDGPTKLPHVDRAIEFHDKREVFQNVKKMSLRAFKEYSRAEAAAAPPSKIRVVGNQIFIGKKLAITLADELDPKTRAYFEKITVQAGEALEDGEVLYTTRLYDMEELRRFERGAEKLKKDMRINPKTKRR